MEISVSASKILSAEHSLNIVTLKMSLPSMLCCHCLFVTLAETLGKEQKRGTIERLNANRQSRNEPAHV